MPFNWHVYLSETGAEVSPSTLFEHVCRSFQPIIRKGSVFEALVVDGTKHLGSSNEGGSKWWPAEVVLISGYLVLLKWCVPGQQPGTSSYYSAGVKKAVENSSGHLNSSEYFWFDVKGSNWDSVRPLDRRGKNSIAWSRPEFLSLLDSTLSVDEQTKWLNELRTRAAPDVFFDKRVLYQYEAIKVGGYFECEHANDPRFVWPVQVLMNVGGRVKLTWFGGCPKSQNEADPNAEALSFTLFYTHRRVHPLGWATSHGLCYRPPHGITLKRSISNVDTFVRGALPALSCSPSSDHTFDSIYHHRPPLHEFKEGWKLEAVNPMKPYLVQPATVAQVFDSRYFLVQLDDLRSGAASDKQSNGHPVSINPANPTKFVSYASSAKIMPVNTSQLRGLHLASPPGWPTTRPFTWTNYLTFLSTNQRCSPTGNGLLRAASTSSLISTVEPLNSGSQLPDDVCNLNDPNSGVAYSSTNHLLVDDSQLSTDNVPFCPSESVFKGTTLVYGDAGGIRVPSLPSDSILGALSHDPTVPNDSELDSCSTSRLPNADINNPDRFLLGMKLELVLPRHVRNMYTNSHEIGPPLCTGTVTRIHGAHLLWVLPDLDPSLFSSTESSRPIMVDARSTQLYPVGWASFVGHPIIAPVGYEHCKVEPEDGLPMRSCEPTSVEKPEHHDRSEQAGALWDVGLRLTHSLQYQTITYEQEEICPPIYINTKCYLGPFLCKTSLELLPRRFGPGPTTRVMHYLLTRLVSAAYKPIRVLRMFEADWASGLASAWTTMRSQHNNRDKDRDFPSISRARAGGGSSGAVAFAQAEAEMLEQRRSAMCVVLLRIRCPRRGVKIDAPVEVCCRSRAVEEFCRQISLVLEACPHLISLTPPDSSAPSSSSTHSGVDILSSLATVSRRSRDTKAIIRRELSFGSLMFSPTLGDCPSFCASRLRSRNLDRLPGWKRRMFASLRPFGVRPPADMQASLVSVDRSVTGLRTRAAAAAAQQQTPEDNDSINDPSQSTMIQDLSGLINGLSGGTRTRRNRSRVAGRFRGTIRRVQGQRVLYSGSDSYPHAPKRSFNSVSVVDVNKSIHDTAMGPHGDAVNASESNGVKVDSCERPSTFPHAYHSWRNHILSLNGYTGAESPVPDVGMPPDGAVVHPSSCDPHFSERTLCSILADAPRVTLTSNPLFWSPVELASYLGETDCREMWPWLAAEAVDGQAFMLLTLPVLHQLVGLRWEDAIRLARHVVSVKRAFMEQFGTEFSEHSTSCSTPS